MIQGSQLAISEIAPAEIHQNSYFNTSQVQLDLNSDVEESKATGNGLRKKYSNSSLESLDYEKNVEESKGTTVKVQNEHKD